MMLHPDVQRRAQKELDEVVGQDRLPNFEDAPSLPFIEAIVKEVIRFVASILFLLMSRADKLAQLAARNSTWYALPCIYSHVLRISN